jgi:hypothetical protein
MPNVFERIVLLHCAAFYVEGLDEASQVELVDTTLSEVGAQRVGCVRM